MSWTFKTFLSARGKDDVASTYENGSGQLQAQLDETLGFLVERPRQEWGNPRTHAARLNNAPWKDFYELRFFANNIQQRPIGFFGPSGDEFIIVLWCTEKGGHLVPPTWFAKAFARRNEILSNAATTVFFKDRNDL